MEMLSIIYFYRVEQNLKQKQVLENMECTKIPAQNACGYWQKKKKRFFLYIIPFNTLKLLNRGVGEAIAISKDKTKKCK